MRDCGLPSRGTTQIQELEDLVERKLVIKEGRKPLAFKNFDPILVRNQAQCGRPESDLEAMFIAHNNDLICLNSEILGIREETRQRYLLNYDQREIDVVSKDPTIITTWIGGQVGLLTVDEAKKTEYAGRTAYDWAKSGDRDEPEMVVRAGNGLFYRAMYRDRVLSIKGRFPR